MLYLVKVYRQQEIQDGGLKKGNALSLTVILEVTYCIHQISSYTSHRNIIPTTMSMFVRLVSRLPLISMPHSRKRNPDIAIMTTKLEDYFILGPIPQPLYGIFQRQFRCLLKSARHCTHTITVCLHWWDIGGLSWQMSLPGLHSIQARPVWPQDQVSVWRQFQLPVQPSGIPWKGKWVARTAARSKSCKWSPVYGSGVTLDLSLTIFTSRTHWLSSCSDKTWHCWAL